MTKLCALCQTPLTEANSTEEHIIPNAIGGRKTVRDFICRSCNSKTGHEWDSELTRQLQPFSTMLGIKRESGDLQPVPMRGADNKEFALSSDASITIPHTIRSKHFFAGKTHVNYEVKSKSEARKVLLQVARKHPILNVEAILSNAISLIDQMQNPLRISLPLFLSGEEAGRSIVKSCLGLAYQAGVSVDDCEHARRYLEGIGDACFGHYNETDLVKNRPVETYFHCIRVCGGRPHRQILAYAEYFGYQRIVARLSDNYSGDAFDICYAIDPVSGEKLDLDVALEFSQADIPAILANEKVDQGRLENCLKGLLDTCLTHLIITNTIENANAQCGVKSDQALSEEQLVKWSNLVADSLARILLGSSPDHPLGISGMQRNVDGSTS